MRLGLVINYSFRCDEPQVMVTKAYLDSKLLPSLERVLKEVGPDSLYEALHTAYPDASLPPISNIENIEIFVQFGGGCAFCCSFICNSPGGLGYLKRTRTIMIQIQLIDKIKYQ